MLELEKIPADFPVRPIDTDDPEQVRNVTRGATCGTCGLTWDDAIPTSMTPAPAARCPFEYFHEEPNDDDPAIARTPETSANVFTSTIDGEVIVQIDTGDREINDDGTPRIRIYLNDATIYNGTPLEDD
jgi:hypothetical protein